MAGVGRAPARTPAPSYLAWADAADAPPADRDRVLDGVKKAVACLEGNRSSGTAFVVARGILATNNHVLQDEYIDNLRVRFISPARLNPEPLRVKLLYRDRSRDLALLGAESEQGPLPLASGDKEFPRGHPIALVGHPSRAGGVFQELYAVSEGTLEGLARRKLQTWYHLKANAAPGNSGGPVIDRQTGEVLGIVTWGLEKEPGHTFCVPVADLHEAIAAVTRAADRERLSQVATARYAAEMVTLQALGAAVLSGEAAVRNYKLRVRGGRPGALVLLVDDYLERHKELMRALGPAVWQVRSTPHLPSLLQRQVEQLLTNCEKIRRHAVTTARMGNDTYLRNYNELLKAQERLAKAVCKELAVPDEVKVRLLNESDGGG